MALLVGELIAALRVRDDGYNRDLGRAETRFRKTSADVDKSAGGMASRVGTHFRTTAGHFSALGGGFLRVSTVLGGGLVTAAAAGGLALLGLGKSAEESRRVSNLTVAAIKSTGGAAKISADQVGALSTAISNKTGIDDEAIQSGENLLLTFTNIRNEAGKGNDIFNQASQTITDMTAALNGGTVTQEGMKASSIQLGKALNDPIKGVGALSRVGVSFTEQQKKQIKTLVDSGNTLGAQKIVLGELRKEFGGAAVAAASPMQKLQTIASNMAETLGGYVLPIIDRVATYLGKNAGPAMARFGAFIEARVIPAARQLGAWFQARVLPVLVEFATFVRQYVLPALVKLAGFIGTVLVPFVGKVLAGALQGARNALENVRAKVKENEPQLRKLAGAIAVVVGWLAQKLGPILGWIAKNQLTALGGTIGWVIRIIAGLVTAVSATIGWFRRFGGAIAEAASTISRFFSNLPGNIKRWIGNTGTWIKQKGRDLIGGLLNGIVDKLKGIGGWVKANIVDPVVDAVKHFFGISSPSKVFEGIGANMIAGLLKGMATKSGGAIAKKVFGSMPKALAQIVSKGLVAISALPQKALDALQSVGAAVGTFLGQGFSGDSNVSLGRQMAASYGWTGASWQALYRLWAGESSWDNLADNPYSTAFGIPQFLAGTARQYGVYGVTDPGRQIAAGMQYIRDVYGDPQTAYALWSSRDPHWYEKGAWRIPSDRLVGVHRDEMIMPARPAEEFRRSATGPVDLSDQTSERLGRIINKAVASAMNGARLHVETRGGQTYATLLSSNG